MLAAAPGFPFAPPHRAEDLALLDDPQEWSAFGRLQSPQDGVWESHVVIEGMHCAACASTVEDALAGVPGVLQAQVSAASRRAKVQWADRQVRPSQWMQAVQQVGYRAVPANDVFVSERRKAQTRKALWRWLVAGLCMMQVMMYAYPAYIAHPGDLSAEMEQLLRWASWVITLPMVLFSCGPFFSSAWRDIRLARISMDLPVAIGMAVTFAVSTAGTFAPQGMFGREVYFDSLTMFVFFLLSGRWLELRLRDRTAGALEALMNRLPDSVERQCAPDVWERVAARRIQVGDTLRVQPGETFVADGVLAQGNTQVDESLLTGESHPQSRGPGDGVVAGSHNLTTTVQMQVRQVGGDTRFSQIVALMQNAALSKPQGVLLADRLAKPFLLAVLLAAALACAWWWPTNPEHALMVAVAVLVVTCPCALSLAAPAAMLAAAGALARHGVLVRDLSALERLAHIDTVVFDKTGTLTRDAMVVGAVHLRAGANPVEVWGMASALAQHSMHPVSRAIVQAALSQVEPSPTWVCSEVTEVAGQGVHGWVTQGHSLRCHVWLGSAPWCGAAPALGAGSQVHMADDQGWLASFDLQEEIRPDAAQAVQGLQALGVQVHVLSGDSANAVAAVAGALGISNFQAGCTPADKLQRLQQWQAQGHRVAMVGDGMNDGPVLAGAQVSFAFGRAVPLAQAQSDVVVMGERLLDVLRTVQLARKTMRVVHQNLWWALIYNACCVPLALLGYLPAWLAGLGMATSSLLVVLNALRLSQDTPRIT
jgi:P-type Cu2+ transporter